MFCFSFPGLVWASFFVSDVASISNYIATQHGSRPIVARNSARFAYFWVIPARPRANLTESLKSEWIGFLWRVTRPQLVYVDISWHWSTSQQHWFFFIVHFHVYSSGCKQQVSVCSSAVFTGVVCLLSITTDNFEVCSGCVSLHIGFLCFTELSAHHNCIPAYCHMHMSYLSWFSDSMHAAQQGRSQGTGPPMRKKLGTMTTHSELTAGWPWPSCDLAAIKKRASRDQAVT